MSVIVAGIGTEVGKTVVATILCQALHADYWKPVQAGDLEHSDSHTVRTGLAEMREVKMWPEAYCLTMAMSPHAAAKIDGVTIELDTLLAARPPVQNLIIELAGGLMVPLSDSLSTIDLVKRLSHPVILVANYYLGSINHTLLSIHLLKAHRVPILGIIFNGITNSESRDIILSQGNVRLLGEIPDVKNIDASFIKQHAKTIRKHPAMARL